MAMWNPWRGCKKCSDGCLHCFGRLFLEVRLALQGEYDVHVTCQAEKSSLDAFKEQYANKLSMRRITDIGFEDYYLINDLVCHKYKTVNPEQYFIRESMRVAYLLSIYNDALFVI